MFTAVSVTQIEMKSTLFFGLVICLFIPGIAAASSISSASSEEDPSTQLQQTVTELVTSLQLANDVIRNLTSQVAGQEQCISELKANASEQNRLIEELRENTISTFVNYGNFECPVGTSLLFAGKTLNYRTYF